MVSSGETMRRYGRRLVMSMALVGAAFGSLLAMPADEQPWSERVASLAIERWPSGNLAATDVRTRNQDIGFLLNGMDAVWLNTAGKRYYDYIKGSVDQYLQADGPIPTDKAEKNWSDHVLLGRQFLLLYGVTGDERYLKAATMLYRQLAPLQNASPFSAGNAEANSDVSELEELYRSEPFYAQYASISHHAEAFREIAHRFGLVEKDARDGKTGLLHRRLRAATDFRAQDMGWHMMALVDTLQYFPEEDADRRQLMALLQRDADAVVCYEDRASGLWYRLMNRPDAKGNPLDYFAAETIMYALSKGVREGYLSESYLATAERAYRGVLSRVMESDEHTPDEVGAFLLASVEAENSHNARLGRGRTVLVDAWYNSQEREDAFGHQVLFHYKWDDQRESGFSLLGHLFHSFGAKTGMLTTEPTAATLRSAQVYLIVSPDIPVKNPRPNYMTPKDADAIAEWVKAGGVLMMMENDPPNADIEHLNLLADRFGIHFNNELRNHVEGTKWEMGTIAAEAGGPIFHERHTLFMKDTCTITVKTPATSVLRDKGDILMAVARYGKGTVFATVDPWLYNEYTDGRKLPAEYDNFAAGKELVRWVLEQVPTQALPPAK